jgi:hypothetical protein
MSGPEFGADGYPIIKYCGPAGTEISALRFNAERRLDPDSALARRSEKCSDPSCGHALSMHNDLGYCRPRSTPDRSGECLCGTDGAGAFAPTKDAS